MSLKNKKVLLGCCGSIALYKACDLIQRLKDEGAEVRAVLTPSAGRFVSPLTFSALTGFPALIDAFDKSGKNAFNHLELAQWADLYLIAPGTANTIGEMANGITRSLVSMVYLGFPGRVYLAPAMNTNMLEARVVRENLEKLKSHGVTLLPTGIGDLACGQPGRGKLLEVQGIVEYLKIGEALSSEYPKLKNLKSLVILGRTQENIDAVRYLSNRSSGKTGLSIAGALQLCGVKTHLVCGNLDENIPNEYSEMDGSLIKAQTTRNFHDIILDKSDNYDIIVVCAALADFVPKNPKKSKIKNSKALKYIELKPSVNILGTLAEKRKAGQIIVGFALENQGKEYLGLKKWDKKTCDVLVINTPGGNDAAGFGSEKVRAGVYVKDRAKIKMGAKLPMLTKYALANKLLRELNRLS